jgi:hypothetical protein
MQRFRACAVSCLVVFLLSVAAFGRDFSRPVAKPCNTYPAHDDHAVEKLCIAADPYDTPDKARTFSVDFQEHGFLPVFFIVTNNGDHAVSLANLNVQFITAHHSKLTPVAPDDMYRRMSNPQARTTPLPIPIPRKRVKGTISRKDMDEIESSQFAAHLVEPHATQTGFLFFDVQEISNPLAGANLDVTGLFDADGKEFLYFEVSMEKYSRAPQ